MDLVLGVVFVAGALAASLANAAACEWAWDRRRVSPWQPTPEGCRPRGWLDRFPVFGWLRLRRDTQALGRWFWVRPMLVEAGFGAAMAALWWWEVERLGLVTTQLAAAWPLGVPAAPVVGPAGLGPAAATAALCAFAVHAVLAWLMLVASLVDIDEKSIPSVVTDVGVLIGLALAAFLPWGLLPNAEWRPDGAVGLSAPLGGFELLGDTPLGGSMRIEPTHAAAPEVWYPWLAGRPATGSLWLGLGCFWFWCLAIAPRRLRTRRGLLFGVAVVALRILRALRESYLGPLTIAGSLLVAMVWFAGGAPWEGLLTSLLGVAVGGGVVWAVRIVASWALAREAMGFGDVMLLMMIGAMLGWQAAVLVFFLAPIAGLVAGVLQLALRSDDEIPYGPFLCLAAAGVVAAWGPVWSWAEPMSAHGPIVGLVLGLSVLALGGMLRVWRLAKERLLGWGA